MTAVLDRETLADMDDDVRHALEAAADQVQNGSDRLHAAVKLAAERGEKAAVITRVINHAWTYDYVARLVRKHRPTEDADES